MAILKILSGERSGQTVDLRGDVVVVGRHPGCDIRVPDETVSRRHARIISQRGGYYVEDLGSRNGTFLNGQPITSLTRLCHLDRINIFNTTVEYRDEGRNGARDDSGDMTITLGAPLRSQHPGLHKTTAEIDLTAVAGLHRGSRRDVKLPAGLRKHPPPRTPAGAARR